MEITINNWRKYNTRNDIKSTSWFRLQNDFWIDPKFFDLKNDDRMVFITLLCIASKDSNATVHISTKQIATNLGMKNSGVLSAIDKLAKLDVIIADVTSTSRARVTTDRTGQTDRTDRTGQESPSAELTPNALFNLFVEEFDGLLSKPRSLSDARKRAAIARIRENPSLDTWKEYFARIKQSRGLLGFNDRGWKADFDWVLKPDSMTRVLEGKYDKWGQKGADKSGTSMKDKFNEIINEMEKGNERNIN